MGSIVSITDERKMPKYGSLKFKGRVYVLISNYTFSSAVDFASAVKDYKLGTLVGEETGGLASPYGATHGFDLPNTKIAFSVSSKHIFRYSGKDDGHGILPDYEVKQSVKDLVAGVDTVMEFTKKLILSKRPH